MQTLLALGKHYKFTLDTKWKDLPKKTQDAILYGSGDTEIRFSYDDGMRAYDTKRPFEGVITNLERRFKETDSDWAREEIARYFTDVPCAACHGYRLKPEALCVQDRRHCTSAKSPTCRSRPRRPGSASCRKNSTPSRTKSPCASSRRSARG